MIVQKYKKVRAFTIPLALLLGGVYFFVTALIMFLLFSGSPPQPLKKIWLLSSIILTVYFLFKRKEVPAERIIKIGDTEINADEYYKRLYEYVPSDPSMNFSLTSKEESIAERLVEEFKNKYEIDNKYTYLPALFPELSTVKTIEPQDIYLTNEEAYDYLQKEMDILQKYDPNKIVKEFTELSWKFHEKSDVDTNPITSALYGIGIDYMNISSITKDIETNYSDAYKEAIGYTKKQLGIIGSGVSGENRVNEELALYDYLWENFSSVRFEINGQSVETDNLIISKKGIYSLEVKNYAEKGNYSIHLTKDGQWLKCYPNGKIEPMEKSVTTQMNRHIAMKQKLIYDEWNKAKGEEVPFIPFQPIFVIANETVRVQNDTDLPVMRASQVYHHISKQPNVLEESQVKEIAEIVQQHMLPPKKYSYKQYSGAWKDLIQDLLDTQEMFAEGVGLISQYKEEVKKTF